MEQMSSGPLSIIDKDCRNSRCFYTPPIDLHCNHQRRNLNSQRNGGVGDEERISDR